MLLMKLQSKEKFSFLQLAHYLARIDNKYGQKEEEIILEYCTEMGIENLDNFDFDNFSLEKILNDFKSETSKKIPGRSRNSFISGILKSRWSRNYLNCCRLCFYYRPLVEPIGRKAGCGQNSSHWTNKKYLQL